MQNENEKSLNEITIKDFSRDLRKKLRKDDQVLIAITGVPGSGKSTFATWCGLLVDPRFDLTRNISFFPNEKEVVHEFNRLRKYQYYLLDEAARVMFKYDWQNKLQQVLLKLFMTERWQNKAVAMCIPSFWDLNANMRNERVQLWCWIPERGRVFIYKKDDDKDNKEDPWHSNNALKLKQHLLKRYSNVIDIPKEKRYDIERKMPTYVCDFSFPDLPENIKKEYLYLKERSRKRLEEEGLDEDISKKELKYKFGFVQVLRLLLSSYKTKDIALLTRMENANISKLRNMSDDEVKLMFGKSHVEDISNKMKELEGTQQVV